MRKLLFIFFVLFLFSFTTKSYAFYNPVSLPNNIFGIHILFPAELSDAAKLVNSGGGDWGYVTIPIQYSDRDIVKWQNFFNDCSTFHLIPIVRLATDPYYINTGVWAKPNEYNVLDFANFLNSLTWPTKNRYIVLFNEPNRYDEWGGEPPSPKDYADLVMYAEQTFHNENPDFFLITAGLDNASPNDGVKYMDNFVYIREMGNYNSDVFKNIDGIASHSYPNPGFSVPPLVNAQESTSTYKFEENIISRFAGSEKPVFITETGWSSERLAGSVIGSYYKTSFESIWEQDKNVIAVTPFLLDSQNGQFDKLSFMKNNELTAYAKVYQDLQKQKGLPPTNPMSIPALSPRFTASVPTFKFGDPNGGILGIKFDSGLLRSYIKEVLFMNSPVIK